MTDEYTQYNIDREVRGVILEDNESLEHLLNNVRENLDNPKPKRRKY